MTILLILFMLCLLLALVFMVKFTESVKSENPDWKYGMIATLYTFLGLALVIIRFLILQWKGE